jgi:ABC-2 type transport system permease protein
VNAALFRLALRRLLLRRRSALLAFAPLLSALVAVIQAAGGTAEAKSFASLMEQLFLPLILPFLALVIGASALGEERDDGTILYLASTPLPRLAIALPAIAAAALTTFLLCVPGLAITVALSPGNDLSTTTAAWAFASVLAGACTYAAAFGALSLRVKRPVVIGLVYVLFWEGSIATFAPSARWLSLGAYARAIVAGGLPSSTDANVPAISAPAALAVLAAVTALATWWCGRRLTRIELP